MLIEIWSDFGCPFCHIAEKRLENALKALHAEHLFTIELKSFELDPSPVPQSPPIVESYMRKYSLTEEKARNWILKTSRTAAGEGLDWDYLNAKAANTFDAHRLAKFGASKGVKDMPARLFKAYFKDGADLGDSKALQAIAAEAGLDAAETASMLDGGGFADAVLADEREAAALRHPRRALPRPRAEVRLLRRRPPGDLHRHPQGSHGQGASPAPERCRRPRLRPRRLLPPLSHPFPRSHDLAWRRRGHDACTAACRFAPRNLSFREASPAGNASTPAGRRAARG